MSVSMSDNRTRVCVDTVLSIIVTPFQFCQGHVENETTYNTTGVLLDRRFGSILLWVNSSID